MISSPIEIQPGMSGTLVLMNGSQIAVYVVSRDGVWITFASNGEQFSMHVRNIRALI